MGLFDGLFRSRDKPQDRTAGSSYTFFMGGSTAGKNVSERSAMHDLSCCQHSKRGKWLKLHWTLAVSKIAGKMI